jgi:hypothetical protein
MSEPTHATSKSRNQGGRPVLAANEAKTGVSLVALATQIYPSKSNEIINRGLDSLRYLDRQGASDDYDHRKNVCLMLREIRNGAMAAVGISNPRGKRYGAIFDHALRIRGLDRYCGEQHAVMRSLLIKFAVNIEEIEAWRNSLSDEQRTDVSSPLLALRMWEAWKAKPTQPKDESDRSGGALEDSPVNPVLATLQAGSDAEVTSALRAMGLNWFLQRQPDEWRPQIQTRAGGQVLRVVQKRHPNTRLKNVTKLQVLRSAEPPTAH